MSADAMQHDSHPDTGTRQGVGARVLRKEDERHLQGKGRFVADIHMPGMQEVAFLRSPLAHATIVALRKPTLSAAAVVFRSDMVTAKDIVADSTLDSYKASAQPPLASGKVRFVGEPVAMAFAPTRAEAEDIVEQVVAEMEALPVLSDVYGAKASSAETRVHDHWADNNFLTLKVDKNFAAVSEKATVVVTRKADLARQCMVPMEGKAVLAYWDFQFDQLIVYSATQVPHMIRTVLSHCLGLDQEQVRVISPDVGGAFGYKCVLQQEELCIAWLAMTHKKPFRFIEDRREHLTAGANSREHHYELTAYANAQGRILALDAKITIDGGAYSVWPFTIGLEPGQAIGNLPGPYTLEGYRCVTECVATNKPGFVPYRGVARTGVCFAMELLIDAVAREVGREPCEVRQENLVPPEAMPYVNIANKHFDGGDYPASVRKAMEMVEFAKIRAKQVKQAAQTTQRPSTKYIGVGFATYTEQSAHGTSVFAAWGTPVIPGFDSSTVKITPGGGVEVKVGVHSHGQGMETTFAQIVNEILGIDVSRVKVVHGDTGTTPFSTGTYASRSLVMSGGAVSRACKELAPRLCKIGAHLLGVDANSVQIVDGNVTGNGQAVSIRDISTAWYINPHLLPKDVHEGGLEVTMGYKPAVDTGSFTYATHAAVVEVDTDSGHVEILDFVVVEDCGTMINPMVVEGQTYGGVAQGIGTAMFEEMRYDGNGQPLASTLADYMLPGPTEIPNVRIHHFITPSPHTEFGAKGMGEGGAIGPPAAIFNAINDALRGLAVELCETPVTPRKILEALARGSAESKPAAPRRPDEEVSIL